MKKLLLLFTFLLLSVVELYAQNDFRKMNWGDSPEIFKEKYPDIQFEKEIDGVYTGYAYSDYIAGVKAKITYIFDKDEFVFGTYYFTLDRSSAYSEDYLKDYNTISFRLSEKYPMIDAHEWLNDTFKDRPNQLSFAISLGHVSLAENTFTESGTFINHTLVKSEGSIEHTLIYASKEVLSKVAESDDNDF